MAEFDRNSPGESHKQVPSRDDVNLQTKRAIENIRKRLPEAFGWTRENPPEMDQEEDITSSRER